MIGKKNQGIDMKLFLGAIFAISFIFTFIGCSKDNPADGISIKYEGPEIPDISVINHPVDVVEHTEIQGVDLNLEVQNFKASIPLTKPTFDYPVQAKNCGGKVFTQYLEGTRVGLKNGQLDFIQVPAGTLLHNAPTVNARSVFHKIVILNDEGIKVEKKFFIDLMDKANHGGKTDYFQADDFFCDESGELYLSAKLINVRETKPGSGFFTSRENDILLNRFYHIDTKSNLGKLTNKREITNFHPQQLYVAGKKLFGFSLAKGVLSNFRFSLPDFTPEKMNFLRIHEGDKDEIMSLHLGPEGNLYASGIWVHNSIRTLELLKFDSDLDPLTDIVTDNADSGTDGTADIISKNGYFFLVTGSVLLGDDLLLGTNLFTNGKLQYAILAIDKNNGELDPNFHKSNIDYGPTNSFEFAKFFKEELVLIASSSANSLVIRIMDNEGKLRQINGKQELTFPKTSPIIRHIELKSDKNALVYFAEPGQKDLLGFVKVTIKE